MKSDVSTNSVICLHPVLEERGKVKGADDAYRVSLKDCLACSGCAITEDDLNLLAHQDPTKVLENIREHPNFSALISTASLSNLAASRGWSIQKAFSAMSSFLTSLGASYVTHDGLWQMVWRYLLIDFYKENEKSIQKPLIISRCAGAVMFFERKTKYANLLAQFKPFPQLFALYQKHLSKNPSSFVMNVAPCYDRKLETGRFPGDVDAAMAVGEIDNMINDTHASSEPDESHISVPPFAPDNDALFMLKVLAKDSGIADEITIKESGNTIEYHCGNICSAFICGEAALRRLCANIDRNKCRFDIVEADLCPNACMAGGGLIRADTPSKRRELVSNTISLHKDFETYDIDEKEILSIVQQLKQQDISAKYASEPPKKDDFTF
ncbi:hypothetical protein M9Y10_022683 [Tritrichomonas musculus]|uniref:Iron hydrogenase large subunit C-terminal domain-containing protein n=1 Tax=Tritrichomonas musculus TaxID=1915356 RepID=A0ABR2KSZ0_9EUKA